uniref:PRC-barrel domain-containing protein n=1 Tax=Helicotheca tamesis TaxID=374047 RepID=A0A7S2GRG5_9STRA|mmetsp:Transcript_10967/g.15229  ORF Transcript_10967/g.15229 Transcript_10967/m.15229 type:complete len:213 (+) Transcript_10967:188-826(+)|eukprot:CAMPEP_0185730504 /NCGR_PEP_ID=MMETSP1171-20130828/10081_1 /TAXON_ID=374046 /ORGANISM="Helicotheca tamensis, Strain CCMP826" /LENGTH=212 /DNA_ID=CAMNT_0028399561 /DNA_START=98 /DNA_END=736 /DNA_ORIENTATION=-
MGFHRRKTLAAMFSTIILSFSPPTIDAFMIAPTTTKTNTKSIHSSNAFIISNSKLYSSDWADFAYDDEDEDLDTTTYADENDSQEYKAEIGRAIEAPTVEGYDGEPIFTPQGSVLPLTVENIQGVLAACRVEIGTMFGYTDENRGVGITGAVDFIDLDGPIVILKLKGRFWHQRPTVLARVSSYLIGRIPEIVDVIVDDPWELTDEANDMAD